MGATRRHCLNGTWAAFPISRSDRLIPQIAVRRQSPYAGRNGRRGASTHKRIRAGCSADAYGALFVPTTKSPPELFRRLEGSTPVALSDRYPKPDTRTAFEKWLDTLTEPNRHIIDGWLHDPTLSNVAITAMIRDDDPDDGFVGYRANKDSISAWRRANVPR